MIQLFVSRLSEGNCICGATLVAVFLNFTNLLFL